MSNKASRIILGLILGVVWGQKALAEFIPPAAVLEAAQEYIQQNTIHPADKLEVSFYAPLPPVEVPVSEVELKIFGDIDDDVLGRLALKVDVYHDNQRYKTLYPVFKVDVRTKVIVTKRWIKHKEVLSWNNLILKDTGLAGLSPKAVFNFEDVSGKVAKVSLPQGKVLSQHHVEVPDLIKRKQMISLVLKDSKIMAQARGIALADGKLGEYIKVKNIDSGKVVYGQVKDASTVLIANP
jgi:flagellar basal body P-ring formation protein FlgA